MNEKIWESSKGTLTVFNDSLFHISFSWGIYNKEYDIDTLGYSFTLLRKKLGKQTLYNRSIEQVRVSLESTPPLFSFISSDQDGEMACDVFRPNELDSVNNWINITKQEGNFKKVWGTFSVTIKKEEFPCSKLKYPDSMEIRNGSFYIEL